jgi:tRNA threonylcarbamoyladenosine biosynthesis protein TsaE
MTTSPLADLLLAGETATMDLGRRLGAALAGRGGVIALSGHLGAGKTTLVKGLAEGLGVAAARDVTSPTFLRVVRFEGPTPLVHVDAYRMKGAADIVELGLDEDMAGGACVAVEWPENVPGGLPEDHIVVELRHVDDRHRAAEVRATGSASQRLLTSARLGGSLPGNKS